MYDPHNPLDQHVARLLAARLSAIRRKAAAPPTRASVLYRVVAKSTAPQAPARPKVPPAERARRRAERARAAMAEQKRRYLN